MLGRLSLLLLQAGVLAIQVQAHPSAPDTRSDDASSSWNLLHHLGNLSPYFDAPVPSHLSKGLPEGCQVDQLSLLHRHGSRNPISSEIGTIRNLSYYLNNHTTQLTQPAHKVDKKFDFLRVNGGWKNTLVTDDLSAVGRKELFDHGVDFRLEYPHLNTTLFLAGEQDRVVESAQWFAAGYLGRTANSTATLDVISESLGVKSYITPTETCKNWKYASGGDLVTKWGQVYLDPIAKQFNRELSGAYPWINFTADNVHGMLYACAYETATKGPGNSDWCNVFSRAEIEDFEYELDLLMRGAFGYGLPNNQAKVLGALYISNLTQRLVHPDQFTEKDGSIRQLFLEFGHDTTIDLILSALGLAFDPTYPATGPVDRNRKWRTSYQVPFAAQMEWRKLKCQDQADRIQLLLNKAPVDLSPICSVDRFGSCTLDSWLQSDQVLTANKIQIDDPTWAAACGS